MISTCPKDMAIIQPATNVWQGAHLAHYEFPSLKQPANVNSLQCSLQPPELACCQGEAGIHQLATHIVHLLEVATRILVVLH